MDPPHGPRPTLEPPLSDRYACGRPAQLFDGPLPLKPEVVRLAKAEYMGGGGDVSAKELAKQSKAHVTDIDVPMLIAAHEEQARAPPPTGPLLTVECRLLTADWPLQCGAPHHEEHALPTCFLLLTSYFLLLTADC